MIFEKVVFEEKIALSKFSFIFSFLKELFVSKFGQ